MEKSRKIYIVFFSCDERDVNPCDMMPLRVFASRLNAKKYAEKSAENMECDSECGKPEWVSGDEYYWNVNGKTRIWKIEEADLDESVEDVKAPEIELENDALKNENALVKEKLASEMARNAAARCFLTMWDHGRYYDKDHVIENMYAARHALDGDPEGDKLLKEMFERWKKNSES